jgi:hypothetical protein
VLYNTIYTQRALGHLKATGVEIADADIERLSPLGTDHITLTGRYLIALPERLRDKSAYRRVDGVARLLPGNRVVSRDSSRRAEDSRVSFTRSARS